MWVDREQLLSQVIHTLHTSDFPKKAALGTYVHAYRHIRTYMAIGTHFRQIRTHTVIDGLTSQHGPVQWLEKHVRIYKRIVALSAL